MDLDAVIGWLALAVALNTLVIALLAVLMLRSGLRSGRVDPARRGMATARRTRTGRASTGRAVRAGPGRAVGPGPVAAIGRPDPLAGAIEAFLGRSDGLFRSGGAMAGPRPAPGGSPRHTAAPGAGTPAVASPAIRAAAPTGLPSRPPSVAAHDRALSDVTWATSRPSRFVPSGPSGPHPIDARGDAVPRAAAPRRADAPGGADPTGDSEPSAPSATGRSASRVSIALSERDGSGAGADPQTVARLGPVIGGFIRERSRANDRITGLTGGRYSVVLPETSLDGGEAFIQRLIQGCDAWLAAEEPPLRLEFGLVALPGSEAEGGPAPRRAAGPERRQAPLPRA